MVKKLKFKVSRDEPEDLPEFKTNAEIGKPPRGLYRFRIVKIELVENSSKDDMLKISTVIDEKDKKKSKWNGYFIITNQNVTEVGSPYLKRFLVAIGTTWSKFLSDTTGIDGGQIQKLGGIKVDSVKRPVYVYATTADDKYEGEERLVVARWVKPKSEGEAEEPDEDDDVEPDDDDVEVDEEGEDESEFDEDEFREELESQELTLSKLKKLAREDYGIKAVTLKGLDEDGVMDLITEAAAEAAEEETDADDSEEEDDDSGEDEGDELDGMNLTELKAAARKVGIKIKEYKGKSDDEIRELIRERSDEPPF